MINSYASEKIKVVFYRWSLILIGQAVFHTCEYNRLTNQRLQTIVCHQSLVSIRSPQICWDDRDDRDRVDRLQFCPDDRDDREWLQAIKWKHLPGDRDDRNPFTFQYGGNNLTNHTKKWRSMNVFITSLLFIIKSSLSDSTAGRTPKEKFLFSSKFVQEYDTDQAPLSSEINAKPKMFPYVFALFFSVFSGIQPWKLASIMPKMMFRAQWQSWRFRRSSQTIESIMWKPKIARIVPIASNVRAVIRTIETIRATIWKLRTHRWNKLLHGCFACPVFIHLFSWIPNSLARSFVIYHNSWMKNRTRSPTMK